MLTRHPPMTARDRSLVLLLALTAALGILNAWSSGDLGAGIDFYQFWAVGQAVDERLVEDIYDPSARPRLAAVFLERAERGGASRHLAAARFRGREIQAASTPFLYWFFHGIGTGEFEADLRRYRLLALAAGILSVLALCRMTGLGAAGSLALLSFALWAFPPLQDDLRDGNVNQIQLGMVTLYLAAARGAAPAWRQALGAAVLGMAIAFKPNLALIAISLAILWLARGQRRRILVQGAGMAAGGAVAVLLSSLFFGGLSAWTTWLGILRDLDRQFDVAVGWGNFAVARLLRDATGMNLSGLLYLACLAAVVLAAWASRRGGVGGGIDGAPPGGEEILAAGLGPVIPLIAAGLAWPHYLVLALPLCVRLAAPRGRPGWTWGALGVALLLVCSTPPLKTLGAESPYLQAWILALGSILLFGLGCRELARPGGPVTDSGRGNGVVR